MTAIIRLKDKWIAVESCTRAGHCEHWVFRITDDDPRFDSLSEAVHRADGLHGEPSEGAEPK